MIDLNLLVYFVAVAEEHSFRRAAERLNIAQPWLSRQIKKLEFVLGFDLFSRTTRTVELTEKGRRLLERAQVMARDAKLTTQLASSLRNERSDKLTFYIPVYGLYVDQREKLFEDFSRKFPNVVLDIRIDHSTSSACSDLENGVVDVIVAAGIEEQNQFETLTLCEGHLDIFLAEGDPLAEKDAVRLSDLAGREVAAFRRFTSPKLFNELFGDFEDNGIKLVEYPNYGFTRRVNQTPGSITVLPEWVLLMREGVVRRPLAGGSHAVKLQMMRRRETASAMLEKFWQLAKTYALPDEPGVKGPANVNAPKVKPVSA
jgi:DNA-binding transcriptional LysR family regulator